MTIDSSNPAFIEFQGNWQLSEEMIAKASKEDIAEAARILAMQAAHYAKKYGEHQLPDLAHLLSASTLDAATVALLRDGTEALVGVLAMVTDEIGDESGSPMQ